MKSFDNIFKETLLQLEGNEDSQNSSNESNDGHPSILNFLQLNPSDQKRIADTYSTLAKNSSTNPDINKQTISLIGADPILKTAFDAYQKGQKSKQDNSTTITTATQTQSQVADSSGSESSVKTNSNPIIP